MKTFTAMRPSHTYACYSLSPERTTDSHVAAVLRDQRTSYERLDDEPLVEPQAHQVHGMNAALRLRTLSLGKGMMVG